MKTRILQFEFPIQNEAFALVPETTQDGARIVKEREQSEADRHESEARQTVMGGPGTGSTFELAKGLLWSISNLHIRDGKYHVNLNGTLMAATEAHRLCEAENERRKKNIAALKPERFQIGEYSGPFPRKKHSHRCKQCWRANYCYKAHCKKPQRIEQCIFCCDIGMERGVHQ